MNYKLQHSAMQKGQQKDNHKYIYREWKNGRWVYYYEDDVRTDKTAIGSNYKTPNDVERERKAKESAKANKLAKEKEKKDKETRVFNTIENAVNRGKKAFEKIDILMTTNIVDLPDTIRHLTKDKY